jgi:hypothetical protein
MTLITRIRLELCRIASCWSVNWAHKPLCHRFRKEVITIGRLVVCRSCTFLYAGLFLALAACAITDGEGGAGILLSYAVVMAVTLLLSLPGVYRIWGRPVRDVLRFSSGALIGASLFLLFGFEPLAGGLGLVFLFVHWRFYLNRRRARKARACDGCPDLVPGKVCPGFERQAEYIREWEEKAAAILTAERLKGE